MQGSVRWLIAVTVLVLALAAPVSAGVYYKSVTRGEGGPNADMGNMVMKGWAEGEKARIEMVESNNPMTEAGTYFLTTDSGKLIYLVNPKEKTYSKWDMEAMVGAAGNAMKAARGFVSIKFSQPKVEKLLEENGGTIVGLPTTHYRYRTSYSMEMKVMGMKQSSAVVNEEEIWSTSKLTAAVLGVWLKKEPPKFGDEQLDALVKAEMGKVQGIPLKTVTVSTTTDNKGKSQVTKTTMEVVEFETVNVPDGKFVLDPSYKEVPMFPTEGAEGEEGEGDPSSALMKMFGAKKKPN